MLAAGGVTVDVKLVDRYEVVVARLDGKLEVMSLNFTQTKIVCDYLSVTPLQTRFSNRLKVYRRALQQPQTV